MSKLLHWLKEQSIYPKVYWKARDSDRERAAVGSVKEFDQPPEFYQDGILFGGMRFSEMGKRNSLWKDFPDALFFQPEFVREEEYTATPCPPLKLAYTERHDTPTQEEWIKLIHRALDEENLEKVVLARRTTLLFEEEIDPYALLQTLLPQRATFFLFQPSEESTFIGATPEKLFERKGASLLSEALAGTRKLTEEFRPKEQREFDFVKHFLEEALHPHCSALTLSEQQVVKTSTVQHLYQKFSGTLKQMNSDRQLLSLLHPTPAIGGKPREKALQFLLEHESFDRGWYAGPIGWISPLETDFAVAIRSALIRKNELHLFAGTGIVEGSDPIHEWEELEYKISQFMRMTTCNATSPLKTRELLN